MKLFYIFNPKTLNSISRRLYWGFFNYYINIAILILSILLLYDIRI